MRPSEIPVKDRRIQKTRDLLHRSLAALIHEKPYDSISVKEILDRANVGRSTFYTHFSDKDELLVSSIHDLLRSIQTAKPPSSAKRSRTTLKKPPLAKNPTANANIGISIAAAATTGSDMRPPRKMRIP